MSSSIKVIFAVYASENKGEIVTHKCQELVNTGNDDIPVNNNTFGDTDPGSKKYFTIMYTTPGPSGEPIGHAKGCQEGVTLDLV
jgi:hypothetical protein